MSDSAAHLVDEVLPKVPVRQWVCSLPWQLRYAMGYDAKLCSAVLAAFMGYADHGQQLIDASRGFRAGRPREAR
jgi:hypothetical protein